MAWGRSGVAFGAAAPAVAAALILAAPAIAQSYRINNVDRAARIHLRESPRGKVLAYIPPDSRNLEGTGVCDARWCEVTFNGVKGWIFRKYIVADPKSAASSKPRAQEDLPVAALPKPTETAKEIPSDLQDEMLQLVRKDGRAIPVYAFPSDRLPAAGRIPPETAEVEDLGTCTRNFCYIRSGSLVGWIEEGAIAREEVATAPPQAIDTNVPTATQAGGLLEGLGSIEVKTYTLAGLSGDASLPLREAAEEGAAILGWVPGDAKGVEGLRKCVLKWCLVRYEALTGWVSRRHLADESAEAARRFQVSGVALWGALDVVEYPGPDAAIIGHIPSTASGIVPIGGCDKDWCHVRYLGVAGWVNPRFLAPQVRR